MYSEDGSTLTDIQIRRAKHLFKSTKINVKFDLVDCNGNYWKHNSNYVTNVAYAIAKSIKNMYPHTYLKIIQHK
jgi:hypothetical protein